MDKRHLVQIDWVKELEIKKEKEKVKKKVLKFSKGGWYKWYSTATNDTVYYTDTSTGNHF